MASGTVTSAPTPLPVPTSTLGGEQLSSPGVQVDVAAGVARPPALRATAWLVADLDAGTVVASCNAHVRLAPASTLKILTGLALVHRLNWSARYVGQPQDAATDGTRVGIVPGSTYTVSDLFHGLMLASGNDAATALSTVAGGMPATTALMNARARELGADDTLAVNDSGLDAPGQLTSAYDLALLGRAALADPLLTGLVQTRTYTFPGKGDRPPRPSFQIQNHNELLFQYPGATGVKNGFTTTAGGSYVGSATRGGHSYLVTVLRAEGNTWHLAKDLLDWAFTAAPRTTPVGRLVAPGEVAAGATAGSGGTGSPTGTATALAGGTRAAASSGSRTADDTRTGWIVLVALGVLLLGGLTLTGRRAATKGSRAAGGRASGTRSRRRASRGRRRSPSGG
jgi:D-alanyl-D-alanine carboxypeptidase (penicillin-binding protein 5/6)